MDATYDARIKALEKRLNALESEGEIRACVSRYMEICDHLDANTPMDELGDLFTIDAIWVGAKKVYKDAFGKQSGRDKIVAFLETYRSPQPHFQSNAHFLTTETLNIAGDRASGRWMMIQTPTFSNGESFVMGAELDLRFRREADAWRIARFKTTNLFSRRIEGRWRDGVSIPVPSQPQKEK